MARYGTTAPDALDAIPEHLKEVADQIALNFNSRTFSSASIGSGGLHIRTGSSLEVLDGGQLDIRRGDLKIGEGQIDGPALKNRHEPAFDTVSASGFSVGSGWATKAQKKITKPQWAYRCTFELIANVYMVMTDSNRSGSGLRSRLWIRDSSGKEQFSLNQTAYVGRNGGTWVFSTSPTMSWMIEGISEPTVGIDMYSANTALTQADSRNNVQMQIVMRWSR